MRALIAAILSCLVLFGCQLTKPISGGANFGIELMHGKGHGTRSVDPLTSAMQGGGVRVVTPEMTWSRDRIYDWSAADSLHEINTMVSRLPRRGAKHIMVGNHRLGATAALAYAARDEGLARVIVLVARHNPGSGGFQARIGRSIDRARPTVQSGQDGRIGMSNDRNMGR